MRGGGRVQWLELCNDLSAEGTKLEALQVRYSSEYPPSLARSPARMIHYNTSRLGRREKGTDSGI
jgi:hypothetical protein